jgi:hypothetical protein
MKTRTIILTLALCFVGVAVCFAEDADMGTWKLNEAKSELRPGAPKNNTVVYEAAGDHVKVTVMVPTATVSRRITSGLATSTAKITRSPTIRVQTCGRTRRSTTVLWV